MHTQCLWSYCYLEGHFTVTGRDGNLTGNLVTLLTTLMIRPALPLSLQTTWISSKTLDIRQWEQLFFSSFMLWTFTTQCCFSAETTLPLAHQMQDIVRELSENKKSEWGKANSLTNRWSEQRHSEPCMSRASETDGTLFFKSWVYITLLYFQFPHMFLVMSMQTVFVNISPGSEIWVSEIPNLTQYSGD